MCAHTTRASTTLCFYMLTFLTHNAINIFTLIKCMQILSSNLHSLSTSNNVYLISTYSNLINFFAHLFVTFIIKIEVGPILNPYKHLSDLIKYHFCFFQDSNPHILRMYLHTFIIIIINHFSVLQ